MSLFDAAISRRKMIGGAAALAGSRALHAAAQDATADASPAAAAQWDPSTVQPQGTFPLTETKTTFRIMVPSNYAVADFATNDFTTWLEERTNVALEWEVLPADDADTALNIRLASGDYGDMLMDFGPAPSVMQLYGSQGVFVPLNDYVDGSSIYAKALFEANPVIRSASTAADGNIYSLPDVNDCYHCSMMDKLWINKTWIDNLGMELPTTTDEFRELMKAFKAQDPNGNGQNDEYALTGSLDLWGGNPEPYFVNAFTYHPGTTARLKVVDGTVTAVYTEEGFKNAIKYLAELFADGTLDPEIFTRNREQIRAIGDGNGGPDMIVGAIAAGWWGEFTTYAAGKGGPWQQYVALAPLAGPDGTRYATFNAYQAAGIGSLLITDKCKDPELAFRWAESLYELEATTRAVHGLKDVDWKWADIGTHGINGKQAWWQALTDAADLTSQNKHWSQSGPQLRSAEYRLSQYVPDDEAATNVEVVLFNMTNESYEPYAGKPEFSLPPLYLTEEDSTFVAELGPTLQVAVDEFFARGATGQADIDAEWDGFQQSLKDMGLEQYLSIQQATYDKTMSAS